MSAMPIALLVTTAATGAVGVAVLCTLVKLRRQVNALHVQLAENHAARRLLDKLCPHPEARTRHGETHVIARLDTPAERADA